jgi:hypothetical protein
MARPKNNTRKLTRIGSGKSVSVAIPIQIVKDLHWREKQKVEVKRVARGVKITDARSKKKRV